jgi:hypothetical protein
MTCWWHTEEEATTAWNRRAQATGEPPWQAISNKATELQREAREATASGNEDKPWITDGRTRSLVERLFHALGDVQWALQTYAPPATGEPVAADESNVDQIVTALYRRFKEWSERGFGPDDVTWCEVKADVVALLAASPAAPDVVGEIVEFLESFAEEFIDQPVHSMDAPSALNVAAHRIESGEYRKAGEKNDG